MKFLCGSCRTKYQISDDKVRGKILTIRCKKCGAKVVVKESLARAASLVIAPVADEDAEAAPVEARAEGASAGKLALGGSAAAVSSATLASAFDVAMGGGLDDMPTSIAPTPSNEAYAGVEWYVAIDGSQVGPFAYAELVRKIQNKDVIGRHYVWHDGFDNWRRVRDVPDLGAYLPPDPSKKKPPPPPAPPGDEDNKVVDFAQKRAERDKRAAGSPNSSDEITAGLAAEGLAVRDKASSPAPTVSPGTAAPAVDHTSPGRDRVDQLDSVLNEALGIAGEDKTARAEPNASAALTAGLLSEPPVEATSPVAAAIMAPAGAQSAPVSEESFASDKASDSFLPEDLFDKVPRASAQEMVARESTRFFVAAAGVNSQKKKNRFGIAAAAAAAIALVAFAGLWAGGVIQISLPGIGNPFDRSAGPAVEPEKELQLTDEDLEQLKKLTAEEKEKRLAELKKIRPAKTKVAVRPKASTGPGGGYVEDAPSEGSGGSRGGDPVGEKAKIDLGGGTMPTDGKKEAVLPGQGGPVVPAVNGEALTSVVIYKIVQDNVSAVTDCTRRERNAKAELKGKLEMSLSVEPDGSVSKVSVMTPSFKGSGIASCIAERMKNWRFPTFSGSAQTVVVPFVFTSD